jgi:uncharacterized C2H2 Zn-finger protein
MKIIFESNLTCPKCGVIVKEKMSDNSCQYFYKCKKCNKTIKPKIGDCCVYCSYGNIPCPPIQQNK